MNNVLSLQIVTNNNTGNEIILVAESGKRRRTEKSVKQASDRTFTVGKSVGLYIQPVFGRH